MIIQLLERLFPSSAELAELRDTAVKVHQDRDRWQTHAAKLKAEAATRQLVCETLAATNVHLASALERAELLNRTAAFQLLDLTYDSPNPLMRRRVDRWLADYQATIR